MRIGDIVRLTGVSRSTINNYVARGIISAASDNGGMRRFPESAANVVRITNELTSFGFKLEEVKMLIKRVSIEEIERELESLREFRRWVQSQQRGN